MANKQGSSSVSNALTKGGWEKDKGNSSGWTNPNSGEKLTASSNYIKKNDTGWLNVSNKPVIR